MKFMTVLLAGAAAMTMSGTAMAQASATPTYDCALFNECETAAPEAAPEAAPATRGGRTSSTRGWNLSRTQQPSSTKPAATKPAAVVNRPGTKPAATPSAAKPRLTKPAVSQDAARVRLAQGITFVSGSANLTSAATQNIDKLAAAMLRSDKLNTRFRIEGHTDSVGGREANIELSKRRAAAVSNYLVSKGVDSSRLDVVGYGFDQTLSGIPGTSAANRRVEAKPIS